MHSKMNGLALLYGIAITLVSAVTIAAQLDTKQDQPLELLEESAIQAAVERIRPAVVRIDLVGSIAKAEDLEVSGPTSGFIVSPEGHILTSSFAFTTPPASILVTLDDRRQFPARLLATDHSRHLALLKVDGETRFASVAIKPRSELSVGQWSIAVGRAISPDAPNISVGILSALKRINGLAVQTDAAISPANYGGPLIDISGQVIGLLTPLAPDDGSGASGAEWYDSGIGFAVPLSDYENSVARLKAGEDLYPGLLGIAFERGNAMESAPVIASVRSQGPASQANLRVGDQILSIEGSETDTLAALRRVLGRFYSGDTVSLVLQRDESKVEATLTLVRELEPYRHAAIGIRPVASISEANGVEVARLFPNGPASAAGIEIGDRIERVEDQQNPTPEELRELLQSRVPGETISIAMIRGSKPRNVVLELAERIADPYPLPVRETSEIPKEEQLATREEFKLPEFAAACPILIPTNNPKLTSPGLLLLPQSGEEPISPEILRDWQIAAERYRLIVALPGPQEPRGWSGQDIEYIKQLTRTLLEHHQIERQQVALVGTNTPNRVTFALWLANRELIRGVVLGSTEVPSRIRVPENEPAQDCLWLVRGSSNDRKTDRILKFLSQRGFAAASAEDAIPNSISAWVKTLDRL